MLIPNLNMPNEATKRILDRLHVTHNELGFNLIKIKQMSRRFTGGHGILDIQYVQKREFDPERDEQKFTWSFRGGRLEFTDDPLPTQDSLGGTGKVYYMLDDKVSIEPGSEHLKEGAVSGATTGYNREYLATHWGAGFKIVDPEVEKDVAQRAQNIRAELDRRRKLAENPTGEEPAQVPPVADVEPARTATEIDAPLPPLTDETHLPEDAAIIDENARLKEENERLRREMAAQSAPGNGRRAGRPRGSKNKKKKTTARVNAAV